MCEYLNKTAAGWFRAKGTFVNDSFELGTVMFVFGNIVQSEFLISLLKFY